MAVERGDVYAVNTSVYFSKPGIRTITGLEILAKIIDPHLKVPPLKYDL
jgi:iron complex transport system substrate-binding protein